MADPKFLTQLDPNSTPGDSCRTANDQPGLIVFTEVDPKSPNTRLERANFETQKNIIV